MNLRPQLIICLLRQLHEAHPLKLRVSDLIVGCDAMGFPGQTPDSLSSVLEDCKEKGLIFTSVDVFDGSIKRYARTETARVLLAEHGHI